MFPLDFFTLFFFFFGIGVALRDSEVLHSGIILVGAQGPYGMLDIKSGLVACKTSALPTVLLLQLPKSWSSIQNYFD